MNKRDFITLVGGARAAAGEPGQARLDAAKDLAAAAILGSRWIPAEKLPDFWDFRSRMPPCASGSEESMGSASS
jgi:hypothetical protein